MSKLYHMAKKINSNGEISALCFIKPRAIDLNRALWTLRKEAVTCPKCKMLLEFDEQTAAGAREARAPNP